MHVRSGREYRRFCFTFLILLSSLTVYTQQKATDEQSDSESLQKATQNPVASLISVPLQNNTNFDIGLFDRTQNVLNIQPVIPIGVSKQWNLIIRWITPIISQPAPGTLNLEVFGIEEKTPAYFAGIAIQNNASVSGFGDMTPTFFLSPAKPGKLIWGAGPVFILPTGTSRVLGQGKVSIGPSFVALLQPGHWTIGALINKCLVHCRFGEPPQCQPDAAPVLHQLQPEKRLVRHFATYHHRQLGSEQRKCLDRAVWRRRRADHEVRAAAGEPERPVLRQCRASDCRFSVGHAATTRFPLSQAIEGAGKADAREEAERTGTRETEGAGKMS
ncbi:MAG TPA: hypothetical protein VI488_21560 [Candidatus Angelobacter sp.]